MNTLQQICIHFRSNCIVILHLTGSLEIVINTLHLD